MGVRLDSYYAAKSCNKAFSFTAISFCLISNVSVAKYTKKLGKDVSVQKLFYSIVHLVGCANFCCQCISSLNSFACNVLVAF